MQGLYKVDKKPTRDWSICHSLIYWGVQQCMQQLTGVRCMHVASMRFLLQPYTAQCACSNAGVMLQESCPFQPCSCNTILQLVSSLWHGQAYSAHAYSHHEFMGYHLRVQPVASIAMPLPPSPSHRPQERQQ